MALLEIENLSFTYPNRKEKVLDGINLTVRDGEFLLLCGESGCGKTTLLRLLKRQLRPEGTLTGKIRYDGTDIDKLDERRSVTDIGFVMQNPQNQIVTDKVWHELAFGPESLGEDTGSIRRKVAEMSGFFGITDWYHRNTYDLSGGQKQLLNLASVMVMNPRVLLLDEPTGQLDPIAASEFISTLKKVNSEIGTAIILVEHRTEEVYPVADRVAVMDKSKILMTDTPRNVGKRLSGMTGHKMILGLPTAVRLYNEVNTGEECPLNVKEGKEYIRKNFRNDVASLTLPVLRQDGKEKVFEISGAYFRYERESADILKNLDLTVYDNEILAILGDNGAGKTTLMKVLCGANRLYRGKLRLRGRKIKEYGASLYRGNVAYLPQNTASLFVKSKVIDDLWEAANITGADRAAAQADIDGVVDSLGISDLLEKHPFDLSGGEQQKAAFAKILLTKPNVILLDEPTKGIDAYSKAVLAEILKKLKADGKTIIAVTHDVEFAAEYADRCAMLFDGQIVSSDVPEKFFAENNFYTTAASRMSRDYYDCAVTVGEVAELCKINGRKTDTGREITARDGD